jgi:SpoVK/Ycf46/Vps4 family AAA+-type ATPase
MLWKSKIIETINKLNFQKLPEPNTDYSVKISEEGIITEMYEYLSIDDFDLDDAEKAWTVVVLLYIIYSTIDAGQNGINRGITSLSNDLRNKLFIDIAIDVLTICGLLVPDNIKRHHKGKGIRVNRPMVNRVLEKVPLPKLSNTIIEARKFLIKLKKMGLNRNDMFTDAFDVLTEKYMIKPGAEVLKIFSGWDITQDAKILMVYMLANFYADPAYYENNGYSMIAPKLKGKLLKKRFDSASGLLTEKGLITKEKKENIDEEFISLTEKAQQKLKLKGKTFPEGEFSIDETDKIMDHFMGFEMKKDTDKKFLTRIANNSIKTGKLFFNKELERVLDVYTNLLKRDDSDFNNDPDLKGKLLLMFDGAPGTGKTAFANLLAKNTGRDVVISDWHTIHHSFVGESEKNLRKILDEIDKISNNTEKAPVVIINEAEAFLSQRINISHASDKMQNTMVSMLLEWLENSDKFGIVIFTANYSRMIDKAFMRRITKVTFDLPDYGTRSKIWQHMLEIRNIFVDYSPFVDYELSGAEITKILREYGLYKKAYNKKSDDPDFIHHLCRNIKWSVNTPKIGF